MKRKVLLGNNARKALLAGANIVADVVGSTMGFKGKTVMTSQGYGTRPIVTKDGISVAASIMIEDEITNVGVMALRDAGNKTVIIAGDGTSQTIVLSRAIIKGGVKAINRGSQSQCVKIGMDKAVEAVVSRVKELSEPVTDDTLLHIATTSANGDKEIGALISEAYKKIGKNGILSIENSRTSETYTSIVSGFEFNRGWQFKEYVNNPAKMQVVYENPLICVADYDLDKIKDIVGIFEPMVNSARPLIFIAKDFYGETAKVFVVNKIEKGLQVCSIKAPNTYQKEFFSDIALLTGATVISDEYGLKLNMIKMEHLGSCKKIIVTAEKTTIIEGAGKPEEILIRQAEIESLIEDAKEEIVREVHKKRLAQLTGSIGVIYVGASTDMEAKEKLDRVDDSVRACKSAIEEGISCGGGVTLLKCVSCLDNVECDNLDEKKGVTIIRNAIEAPARQILKNAGIYHPPLVRFLMKIFRINEEEIIVKQIKSSVGDIGYNVRTMQFEDLKKAGIIDPTKVIRVALQNANSVAGSVLTSDSLIVDMLENK